jgi:hypothetical protein
MNDKKVQVVILASTDKCKLLEINIDYIEKNLHPDSIVVITAKKNISLLTHTASFTNVEIQDEDFLLEGLSFYKIKEILQNSNLSVKATGWYFQQFLKMAWSFSEKCYETYTVWDCDTFPLQPVTLFWNEKICINLKTEYQKPYFETIKDLLGLEKQTPASFISEYMTIDKKVMNELINKIESVKKYSGSFFEKIISSIKNGLPGERNFSEFETYGTYCSVFYPEKITFSCISTFRQAAAYCGMKPNKFTLFRLAQNNVTASFESWTKKNILKIFLFNIYSFFYYLIKHKD